MLIIKYSHVLTQINVHFDLRLLEYNRTNLTSLRVLRQERYFFSVSKISLATWYLFSVSKEKDRHVDSSQNV